MHLDASIYYLPPPSSLVRALTLNSFAFLTDNAPVRHLHT